MRLQLLLISLFSITRSSLISQKIDVNYDKREPPQVWCFFSVSNIRMLPSRDFPVKKAQKSRPKTGALSNQNNGPENMDEKPEIRANSGFHGDCAQCNAETGRAVSDSSGKKWNKFRLNIIFINKIAEWRQHDCVDDIIQNGEWRL